MGRETNRVTLEIYRRDASGVVKTCAHWDRRDTLRDWMEAYCHLLRAREQRRHLPHAAIVFNQRGSAVDIWQSDERIAA